MKWIFNQNSKRYEYYLFVKEFECKTPSEELMMDISALGRYFLYLNDQFVARGPVRSYEFEKCFDRIDLSPFLKEGRNQIKIISQHLLYGGVYAKISSEKGVILETDESWKCRRYDPLDANTCAGSPPLEPIALNDECFDARKELAIRLERESDWENASFVHREFSRLMENSGGLLGETLIFPEKYMGGLAVNPPCGYGVRFKNPTRRFHKVRKYASELYFCVLHSPVEQRVRFSKNHVGTCRLNGEEVKDVLPLKQGDNLLAFHYYCSIGDCEFFFHNAEQLTLKELELNGEKSVVWVQNLEMSNVHFSWTYPDKDPYKGTDSRQRMDALFETVSWEELQSNAEGFSPAQKESISTSFAFSQFQYGTLTGIKADPEMKLNLSFDAPERYVKGERNLMNQNADLATLSSGTALFFDFGEERLGYLEFELCAEEGTIIEIDIFEVVDFNGMHRHGKGSLRYVCREGWQRYTSFHPKGFRYLCLVARGSEKPIKIRYLALHQTLAALKTKGKFECDNSKINEIYQMSIRSAHACMSDTYVDCPGYEQVYWVGDAKVTSHVNLLNFGCYEYDLTCLNMAARSLDDDYKKFFKNDHDVMYDEDKYLVTPAYGNYVYGGLPLWSFSWIMQCYDYYMHSGDKEGIRNVYPYIQKMLSNCQRMMSDRGLFAMEGAWNLLEWSENDLLPCGEVTGNSALLSLCYRNTAELAKALEDESYENHCLEQAEQIKNAINQYCWSDSRQGYVDSVRDEEGYALYLKFFKEQGMEPVSFEAFRRYNRISEQTNVLVHICGCVGEGREEAVRKIVTRVTADDYQRLKSLPNNNTLNDDRCESEIVALGSPFFFYYIFRALGDYGMQKEMLDVMKREYSFMLSCGTKNCWETFYNPGASEWTRSICHGWGSSPAVYLQTEICGVKPVTPGFETFTFQPNLGGLKKVKSEIATPYGTIYVHIDTEKGIKEIHYPKECSLVK